MAELDQLYDALRKADAAGNTDDAKRLADYIRSQSAAPATPSAPQKAPEDVGFFEGAGAALGRGIESFKEMGAGLGIAGKQIVGDTEAVRKAMAAAKEQKPEEKPGMTVTDFERIAAEQGFAAAAAQAPKYIVEQVLQSAPQMATPLAVGAAASPFITPVGGAIAGIATYGVQQFGNFLMRQAQEKKDPEELDLTKAALTATGTAPLGYFADRFTLGLGSVGKTAGKEILKELAAREGAGAVAKEVGKRAAVGAVEGVIAEAPTEVLEQAAERYQAGLSLTDEKALNEYKEAFFGAAAAGGALGGGAKGAQAYGEYRAEKKALEPEAPAGETRRSAIDEANEYDDTGRPIAGAGEQGILIPSEPGLGPTPRADEGAPPSMAGAERVAGGPDVREETLDNQLAGTQVELPEVSSVAPQLQELKAKEEELNAKLAEVQKYIRDIAEINPNDERIAQAQQYVTPIYNELSLIHI